MPAKTGRRGKYSGYGRVAATKVAWLVTKTTRQLAIHQINPRENDEELGVTLASESGDAVVLMIPVPGRTRPHVWDLTGMTSEELDATRQFFEYLFNLADPVVRERDKVAADAQAKGDDSFDRVYRSLPQFVVRERPLQGNGQGVHVGPTNAVEGAGVGEDPAGGLSDVRDELAYGEQGQGCGQDDGPEAH